MDEQYVGLHESADGEPLLIGHSHTACIFAAAGLAGMSLSYCNFWFVPKPTLNEARTAFSPAIASLFAKRAVFSAIGGSSHTNIGMVRHPTPFDFVLPTHGHLPLDEHATLIPFPVIADLIACQLREYFELLALVRATSHGSVYHFEAPPPLEDGDLVRATVPWDYFPAMTREVSPAPLRFKLWRLAMNQTAEFCTKHDIVFIARPDEAVDDRGYLRPEFHADATHANTRYGALVVAQMKGVL